MQIKKGVLKMSYTEYGSRYETTYNVTIIDMTKTEVAVLRIHEHPNYKALSYLDSDFEENYQTLLALGGYSELEFEWTSPLEVVENGGTSPLDVYPVGIEITTTDTAFNPMKVWGGTWTVTPAGAKRVWKRTA